MSLLTKFCNLFKCKSKANDVRGMESVAASTPRYSVEQEEALQLLNNRTVECWSAALRSDLADVYLPIKIIEKALNRNQNEIITIAAEHGMVRYVQGDKFLESGSTFGGDPVINVTALKTVFHIAGIAIPNNLEQAIRKKQNGLSI